MPDQAAPSPPFRTSIRLPAHRLELDEARFLRLLAGAVSLMKDEKRRIIEVFPDFSQDEVEELMEILAAEEAEFARCGERWRKSWERSRKRRAAEWRELERELSH